MCRIIKLWLVCTVFCCTTLNVMAQEKGYIYGGFLENDDFRLWKYDLAWKRWTTMDLVPVEPHNRIGRWAQFSLSTLDIERKLFCIMQQNGVGDYRSRTIFRYNLEDGSLRDKLLVNLGPIYGIDYNRSDGNYYCLERREEAGNYGVTKIDAETGEVTRHPDVYLGGENIARNYAALNHIRDEISIRQWDRASNKFFWRFFSLQTGALLRTLTLDALVLGEAVHPFSGEYYCLYYTPENGFGRILGILDQETGEFQAVPDSRQTEGIQYNQQYQFFANLDPIRGQYIYGYPQTQMEFYNLQGEHEYSYFNREARRVNRWHIYPGDAPTGPLRGRISIDKNADCQVNPEESGAAGLTLLFQPGDIRILSGQNGEFAGILPIGDYKLSLENSQAWNLDCHAGALNVKIVDARQSPADLELVVQAQPDLESVSVSIGSSQMMLGANLRCQLYIVNSGNQPFNGSLSLEIDELLTLLSSSTEPDRQTPTRLEWDIIDIPAGSENSIELVFSVPDDGSLEGREVCMHLQTLDQSGQVLLSDRSSTSNCDIVSSEAPANTMAVYPKGVGQFGRLDVTDNHKTLTYRIQFQNLTDFRAGEVVIRDTLPHNLDLASLKLGASSHPYNGTIEAGRILVIRFEDIDLPSAAEDAVNSRGFVTFRVDFAADAGHGDWFGNQAGVYFDTFRPEMTNEVINRLFDYTTDVHLEDDIASPDKLELRSLGQGRFVCRLNTSWKSASPSPGQQLLIGKLQVFSVLGTTVYETSLNAQNETTIDLSQQPSGRYLIRLESRGVAHVGSVALMP